MKKLIILGFSITSAILTVSVARAGDGPEFWNCRELWENRNQIYKDAGYCFQTQRAIRRFGNSGCRYDDVNDVPLSSNQRREVSLIQRYERAKSCPR